MNKSIRPVEYKLATNNDIDQISQFIADLNICEENHIAYCGDNSDEIANSLTEDITDIPFNQSFLVATQDDKIIGVIGFDADLGRNSAEVWGPFIKETRWDIALEMWNKMTQLLPEEMDLISMFLNNKNERCIELVDKLGFSKESEQSILIFDNDDFNKLDDISLKELSVDYYQEMQSLHDKVFPNTYYSGEEILERLNSNRKVFIETDDNNLSGYIYVEAEPEYGEGNIEFFAVCEREKGKGVGSKLLRNALKWLLSFESINEISLCVNSQNSKAINLYKKVGFKKKQQLYYFIKKC